LKLEFNKEVVKRVGIYKEISGRKIMSMAPKKPPTSPRKSKMV